MADETGKIVNPHGNEGQEDLMHEAYKDLPKAQWPGAGGRDDSPVLGATVPYPEPITAMEHAATEAAARHNEGKPQMSYLLDAPRAMEGYCWVMGHGELIYGRDNWQRGLDENEIIDSLLRHLQARKEGEIYDPGSGLDHYFHVIANAVFLAEQYGTLTQAMSGKD